MKKHFIFFVSTLLIVLFVSCQKDELTVPVKVDLSISLTGTKTSYIQIDKGQIQFEQIIFEGQRNEGGNIFFNTAPGQDIGPISFTSANNRSFIKQFDIPQGLYSHMEWKFQLSELDSTPFDDDDDNEEDEDSNEEDDNETDDDHEYGLILDGTYKNSSGINFPVIIAIDHDEKIIAHSSNGTGYDELSLSADKKYAANLLLDVDYATSALSRQSLEDADINDDYINPFILISSDENEQLYENILYRLQNSAEIIIN